jgi:precorrin-4/cobalt-precorrin-4 C11-methyltransferase
MAGRTQVPEKESIESFAAHQSTMVLFLSSGRIPELVERLIAGGDAADTPAALVYKATWPEERKWICTLRTLAQTAEENGIDRTALIIVGEAVRENGFERLTPDGEKFAAGFERSKLYDGTFTTGFREGK